MKTILYILITGFIFSAFSVSTGLIDVINGIKAGNASSVSKYFDNTVEITLAGKSNNYSKSQGETILRDFFANNLVKSFIVVHQGDAGGSQFVIGNLVTNNGTFRTTANLKQRGDKQILQEIKFDR